jgi:hypothetical protein
MKPRRRRHAQLHLPPLDAADAFTLVAIFERAIAAIWRAHGDRMAEWLQLREAARQAPGAESEYVDDGNPDAPDDTPF